MLKINRLLTPPHVGLVSNDLDLENASLKVRNFDPCDRTLSSVQRMLGNLEVLNRLNGNYNTVGCCGIDSRFLMRETHAVSSDACIDLSHRSSCKSVQSSLAKRHLQTVRAARSDHVSNALDYTIDKHNFNAIDQAQDSKKHEVEPKLSSATLSPVGTSLIASGKVNNNTTYQYHLRRQQRSRKFRLNLFMYSALYRKQQKVESRYVIEHNPMEDPDATYTSFSNPNYFFNQAHHLYNNNNNDSSIVNGNNNSSISLEKLSLTSDFFSPRQGSLSSYSSCEPTPTTPDRTLILQKLHSPSDDDDDIEVDALSYGEPEEEDKANVEKSDTGTNGRVANEEPRVFFGVGTQQCRRRSRGILGYLAMLEKQALEREMRQLNGCGVDDENDNEQGGDNELPKTMQGGDQPVEPPPSEKFYLGTEINSPDSNDSGFQTGEKTPFLFSPQTPGALVPSSLKEAQTTPEKEVLPEGWQKHEDDDGPYYWHVKSGTIQRDPPPPAPPDGPALCSPRSVSLASELNSSSGGSIPSTPTSMGSGTGRHLAEFEGHALQYAAKSLQSLSQLPDKAPASLSLNKNSEKAVRFAVRSLGWVRIAEEDLTPERSSRAVNKCIVDLSLGRNDINDAVGRWGDGKDLFMDLDHTSLRLVDVVDGAVLNSQPIHSIRVWGVGRDNGRDFAYVARDRGTPTHMCHVFHCETPANEIATTLKDICKKIMLERSLHQSAVARLTRPTDLPNLDKIGQPKGEKLSFQNLYNNARFPTPMEEPRKLMRCHYLGALEVMRPTGRETLNEAIQHQYYSLPPDKWKFVSVAIAPSTITVTELGKPDGIVEEYRVRFLSFMGIALDNVRLCAFIMHTAQNKFICHVFHCDPSAGPMCKTIEAACKLRYQKCLDAHPPKGGLPGKSIKEAVSPWVKAGVQGLREARSGAVQGMMGMFSLFKGNKNYKSEGT